MSLVFSHHVIDYRAGYFETMTSLEKLKMLHKQIEDLSITGQSITSLNQ